MNTEHQNDSERIRSDEEFREFCALQEERMNHLTEFNHSMEELIEKARQSKDDFVRLLSWYTSRRWLDDFERSEILPLRPPCGIYSEDGLYSLFCDLEENAAELCDLLKVFTDSRKADPE